MKIKATLLLLVTALATSVHAGPADGAAFAIRHAQEASRARDATVVANANSGPVTYVANSSGKGGAVVAQGNQGASNIALFKSKKAKSECSSCQAGAKKQ